jgi:hypothetical protein
MATGDEHSPSPCVAWAVQMLVHLTGMAPMLLADHRSLWLGKMAGTQPVHSQGWSRSVWCRAKLANIFSTQFTVNINNTRYGSLLWPHGHC